MPRRQDPIIRFWKYVNKTETCWLWIGQLLPNGYGVIRLRQPRRKEMVHRFSWAIHNGPIPHKMLVLHHCDIPNCINPRHLFIGTQLDNMKDAMNKFRVHHGTNHYKTHLTDDDVKIIIEQKGKITQSELSKRFNVGRENISAIQNRRTWKHIIL